MKVLLIGGTGIISTEVCKLAIQRGYEVFILNRGKRKQFIQPEAKLIIADIRSQTEEEIRVKFEGLFFDVVVDFISFNVDELKKSTAIFSDICNQFIYISSATVYEKQSDTTPITEKTRLYNPDWNYACDKINCENYLLELYRDKKNGCYTIIRPYVTYGVTRIPFGVIPDHANYTILNRMRSEKPVVLWDGGNALCTLTYSKDFAVGVVGLFENEKAFGEAFHIASPVVHQWKDVYQELCSIMGVKDCHIDIPTDYIVACMPRYKNNLVGDKARNMVFDTSKICDVVSDFRERTSLHDGLKSVVEYYSQNPASCVVDYKWDGQIDRMISEYCKKNAIPVDKNKLTVIGYKRPVLFKNKINYLVCRNKLLFTVASKIIGK